MLPTNLTRKKRQIFGFSPAGCARVVALLQTISHGIILVITVAFLSENSSQGSIQSGLEVLYCWPKETLMLPRMFYGSIFILLVGLVMGLLLLQGARMRKVSLLKMWIIYAAVFVVIDIITQTFRGGADVNVCPRIVLTSLFYLVSIWVARCHILDIQPPKEDLEDQIPFILNRIVLDS